MSSITEKTQKGSHFTSGERLMVQHYLLGTGKYPKITQTSELGRIMGKTARTIQREIKRGMVLHTKSDLTQVYEYNAEYAQNDAEYQMSAKGAPLKLGKDFKMCDAIVKKIKDDKYSPYAVLQDFENTQTWPSETRICTKTLYNYLNNEVIPDISVKDLLRKGMQSKNKGKNKPRHSRVGCAIRSIKNRPAEINERKEIGHVEIDTVKSAANTSTACLFTLTDRKSRFELIRKLDDGKSQSIVNSLNDLELQYSSETFSHLFKSLTADNGSEFMDFSGIETSAITHKKRVDLYFAHPYCASERGTNENHNAIIRRFFPKGTDFSTISVSQISTVQTWMNNYPRKILQGKTPRMAMIDALGSNFSIPP